jgi:uncharacterized cupredoxin-like copper-binding protein
LIHHFIQPVMTMTPLIASLALLASAPTWAHEKMPQHATAKSIVKEQKDWGIAGDARDVKRTVEIRMTDAMRFEPARIEVREGETVRLRAVNRGKMLHEIVLGTAGELRAHADLMKKHPGMEHDEPYMAHVSAGRRGDIVWTFNRVGEFDFACLIPGHYEAGMVGRIVVTPR